MPIEILIVDDHSPIIEGYKSILSFTEENHTLHFTEARNCETAYNILSDAKNHFDVVFLDVSIPAYEKLNLFSGEQLIPHIREHKPKAKIIVLTSHTEHFLLYSIYKKFRPESIMIKSDFTPNEFLDAFKEVISGNEYYSQTVREAIKKIAAYYAVLDSIDMQIIMLLADGIKSKSLTSQLSLGKSAIDKRKQKIKDFFKIEKGNDEDIIREAKKQNII